MGKLITFRTNYNYQHINILDKIIVYKNCIKRKEVNFDGGLVFVMPPSLNINYVSVYAKDSDYGGL